MGFNIVATRFASHDIRESIKWYETKQYNLGSRFYKDYDETIEYIVSNPYLFLKRTDNTVKQN